MNEAFNPYREWLGLDAHIEAPNYYELLGLPQFEADAARLLAAADRALVRVRGFRPGAQAAAWARLLDELAAAKRCLCDPQLKQAYDQTLQSGAGRRDEQPRASSHRTPEIAAVNLSPDLFPPGMAPRSEPIATPGTPVRPTDRADAPGPWATTKPKNHVPPDEHSADRTVTKPSPTHATMPSATIHNPVPPGATHSGPARPQSTRGHATPPGQPIGRGESALSRGRDDSPESDAVHAPVPPGPVNAHVAPPRQEPVSMLPLVAIVTAVVVIVTVIILVIALHDEQGGSPLVPQSPPPVPANDTPQPKLGPFQPSVTNIIPAPGSGTRPAAALPGKKTATPATGTVPAGTVPPATGQAGSGQPVVGANSTPPTTVGTSPTPPPTASSNTDPSMTNPPSDSETESTASTSGTNPTGTAPATENDNSSVADNDAPAPMVTGTDVTSPPEPATATPAELKKLGQLLNRARAALSQHEFAESRRLVEQAGQLAKSDEHVALVERLRVLTEMAEQFWSGVATAIKQLQATQEIQVGSGDLIVVVVEVGPDWLTIRNQGRNTRYLVAELPPGLALAIARQSMNEDDPQTQLVFGAGLATVKDLKPIHLEEARRYWERAAAAGADAAPLQAALADQYELGE